MRTTTKVKEFYVKLKKIHPETKHSKNKCFFLFDDMPNGRFIANKLDAQSIDNHL